MASSGIWIGKALQTKLIIALHSSAVDGHSGASVTYHRMSKLFHWSGMKHQVDDWVKQCLVCQQAKHENTVPVGLLQPWPP